MDPRDYGVGERVIITRACVARMESSNRSSATPGYPSASLIALARILCEQGACGEVTHRFRPGFEMSVRFGDVAIHAKDNWVEPFSGHDCMYTAEGWLPFSKRSCIYCGQILGDRHREENTRVDPSASGHHPHV